MMDFRSPFHPRLVHFPIALSLVGAFFILADWFLSTRPRSSPAGAERWQGYGRLSLVLAWLGVLAVALVLVEAWLGGKLIYGFGVGVH